MVSPGAVRPPPSDATDETFNYYSTLLTYDPLISELLRVFRNNMQVAEETLLYASPIRSRRMALYQSVLTDRLRTQTDGQTENSHR